MRRLLFTILALVLGNAFATSEVEQQADTAAKKAAMTDCLKTKTQTECTDIAKATQKTTSAVKGNTTASTN